MRLKFLEYIMKKGGLENEFNSKDQFACSYWCLFDNSSEKSS